MENKKSGIHSILHKTYERLIKIRGQPREIALGFALGVFIGLSPTIGFQMAIAVFLAALMKWNKVSAAIGVWISNPITVPFIYGTTYLVGAKLLGMDGDADPMAGGMGSEGLFDMLSKAPEILWAMAVGGVVVGLPLAVAAYYFCHSAVRKYQADLKASLARQKEKLARKREERKTLKKSKKAKKKASRKKKNEWP